MKLYFIRHGKTEWNLEMRFQGASGDSPLLETSIDELKRLGKHLSNVQFDRIYSSDLPRACHSAEIIQSENQHQIGIVSTPELREWSLGHLEGREIARAKAAYPQQMWAFRHDLSQFDHQLFGAESVDQTTQRTISFVKSLKGKDFQNILIVGHGANLTASIRRLLGYETSLLRKDGGLANASVTILETDDFDSFKLLTWNNLDYLSTDETANL